MANIGHLLALIDRFIGFACANCFNTEKTHILAVSQAQETLCYHIQCFNCNILTKHLIEKTTR